METTRTVIDDFPADRLPEELRAGIDPTHRVRIVVEDRTAAAEALGRWLGTFAGAARERRTTVAEAVDRIRKLRDE